MTFIKGRAPFVVMRPIKSIARTNNNDELIAGSIPPLPLYFDTVNPQKAAHIYIEIMAAIPIDAVGLSVEEIIAEATSEKIK